MGEMYGGAFVVLPKGDGLQASQAIVGGGDKHDITLRSHVNAEFNSVGGLHNQVKLFVEELLDLQPKGFKIPISCGAGNNIDASSIVDGLSSKSLRKTLTRETKRFQDLLEGERSAQRLTSSSPGRVREVSKHLLTSGIGDILKKGVVGSSRLKIDRRSFYTADERDTLGLGEDMRRMFLTSNIGLELIDDIYIMVLERGEGIFDGSVIPNEELKFKVQELAKRYAEMTAPQLQNKQENGEYINRFISISDMDDIRNLIFAVPELRIIFSETFLNELGFKHNVCIKPKWAKPSPPFGDVVATFIADILDKMKGTKPGAVGINHGEEFT